MPELREIISDLAWKIYYNQCDSLYIENAGISKAISEIKSLIKSKLPKKLDMWFPCTGNNEERKFYKEGYNSALTEIEKIMEE